jgi:UDP-N-acetylglucosamine--dolichyl-phosphate N-acetylglucosaminephosphotransferase
MMGFGVVFLVSFLATLVSVPWIVPKLVRAGLVGKDVNKPDRPEVAEMGGFGIVFGLSCGILAAVALSTFFGYSFPALRLELVLAALSTLLLMSLIGIFDDLFAMHQLVKATLPLFAALPLVAVEAGTSTMVFPFIGPVSFGVFYILLLVPAGVAGASNVTNMLAGFNGLEASVGFVACASLAAVAFSLGEVEAFMILLAMCGALLAFLFYNRYPARVFPGDIGTLSIGAVIATAVIVGDFELAGMIVIIPHALDFFIKARNGFPSSGWWGEPVGGKLVCRGAPISLCQWIMKLSGGISESRLVLLLVCFEAVCGVFAIMLFL